MKAVSSTTAGKAATPGASQEARAGAAVTCVFVVDRLGMPLMPTCPRRARLMLKEKSADVVSKSPFVIRILNRIGGDLQPLELKVDPGSRTTGLALVVKGATRGWFCIAAWELHHRGRAIRDNLTSRSQYRRSRRGRKTRYRPPRFKNRVRKGDWVQIAKSLGALPLPCGANIRGATQGQTDSRKNQGKGWLPPSLRSRVDNVVSFAKRILRFCPVSSIPVEQARFDTHALMKPGISGIAYQQGTLFGYEVREYLLEKWERQCAYCKARGLPLQIEHLVPRSRGGTDRIGNLALACNACNQKKGSQPLEVFLKNKPELLKSLKAQAGRPLSDAAAVNATRIALVHALEAVASLQPHVTVSTWTGGRTKFNRQSQGYAKTHWLDAVCVGETGKSVDVSRITHVTQIHAKGRGSRQMCKPDKYGFPRTRAKSVKRMHGFQTGDRVRLCQPTGKYKGTHEGTVSIRANGRFDVKTTSGLSITAKHDRFTLIQRFDGYIYSRQRATAKALVS